MALLSLSPRQRQELEYFASHTPVAKERCRAQALLWLDEGKTAEQVAGALLVSRRTVYYWVDRLDGRNGFDLRQRLADAPRLGRPRAGDDGIDAWIAEVIDTDPRALSYHQTVWTAPLLVRYLRDHHAIDVSLLIGLSITALHSPVLRQLGSTVNGTGTTPVGLRKSRGRSLPRRRQP